MTRTLVAAFVQEINLTSAVSYVHNQTGDEAWPASTWSAPTAMERGGRVTDATMHTDVVVVMEAGAAVVDSRRSDRAA